MVILISPTLVLVVFFLPVVVVVATAAEDCPMVHHAGRSGTTIQKQVACRQHGLFYVTTEADMVQILVSDRRSVHCRVLARRQTRRVGPSGCRTHWRVGTDKTRGVLLSFQAKAGDA